MPFKKFDMSVEPGAKASCNWQIDDCNTEGKKDAPVKFSVYYAPLLPNPGEPPMRDICTGFKTQANGKVVIHGKGGDHACKRE